MQLVEEPPTLMVLLGGAADRTTSGACTVTMPSAALATHAPYTPCWHKRTPRAQSTRPSWLSSSMPHGRVLQSSHGASEDDAGRRACLALDSDSTPGCCRSLGAVVQP